MGRWITTSAVAAGMLSVAFAGSASALDQVSLGTDWKAEAEHGGYYQAIATGIYAKYGIEVSLRQGGPQVNHAQLLAAGTLARRALGRRRLNAWAAEWQANGPMWSGRR